jgi:quaternary ammonium compound-resistance protein SugE
MTIAWIYLGLAAVFEIVFAASMKASDGFTKLIPSIVTVVGVIGGIGFLTFALKDIPVSIAYPIWTGIGALGTVAIGYFYFGESMNLLKGLSILMIVGGIIGLRASLG